MTVTLNLQDDIAQALGSPRRALEGFGLEEFRADGSYKPSFSVCFNLRAVRT
jgi:hypothetical protein